MNTNKFTLVIAQPKQDTHTCPYTVINKHGAHAS